MKNNFEIIAKIQNFFINVTEFVTAMRYDVDTKNRATINIQLKEEKL